MKKRWLSLLLVLCMVLSLAPVSVFAADTVASGTCGAQGANLTWNLDSDGLLTISGTGEMMDYRDTEIPWYDYKSTIQSVVIFSGVTSIGGNAFSYCTNLKSVDIPDGVTSIEFYAFCNCTSLTSIVIPDGVTTIGLGAFYNCTSLTSIVIPDGVTTIGLWAFRDCSSLTSIAIPDSVTSIRDLAFSETAFFNDSSNWKDGILYINNALICAKESVTETVIRSGTIVIADYAFCDCANLTSVVIPDSVTGIGEWTFAGCASLTSVAIPDSVTSIENQAFMNCTSLTNVTIPDSVTSIGFSAFEGCTNLTSVTIPDSVTSIGAWAFFDCTSLTDVYYSGTEAQWNAIKETDQLSNIATIHYNWSGDTTPATPTPTTIPENISLKFDESSYSPNSDGTVVLNATCVSENALENSNITWTCSDPSAITFSATSIQGPSVTNEKNTYWLSSIATVKKPGEYTVTLTVFDKSATTVVRPAASGWSTSDQWSFSNSSGKKSENFDTGERGYYISSTDYNRLIKNLSPYDAAMIDLVEANKKKGTPATFFYNVDGNRSSGSYKEWRGSCFGMSVSAILLHEGEIGLSSQLEGRTVSETKNSDNIRSGTNFYHNQQRLTAWQNAVHTFIDKKLDVKLKEIEQLLASGKPILIRYQWIDYTESTDSHGHAVVAYAVENGPFPDVESDGKTYTYQKRLRIYDCAYPNDPKHKYDIYYTVGENGAVWCLPGHNIISSELTFVDAEGNETFYSRYNNGLLKYAGNDVELLNAVSIKDGSISSAVVNAELKSARLYTLSDKQYSIKTENGTIAMDGIRYVKTGMSGKKVTVSVAENYLLDGTSEVSDVTVFLPEESSYTVTSNNLLSYGFADNNKAVFVNAGASGSIEFKPTCESAVTTKQKTDISVTVYNNNTQFEWDSITVTAENADDLEVIPGDILITVTGDLENATIERTKDGKTSKKDISSDDSTIMIAFDHDVIVPIDSTEPMPSAQPGTQPTVQPSAQPTVQPSTQPTVQPSTQPTVQPSTQPTVQPSTQPTVQPSTQPTSQPSGSKFVDVPADAYYADAVKWAVENKPVVTTGTDSTHFSPNKDCTRAQMVTFLWRAAGEPEPTSKKNPFADVKSSEYYYKAVLWANEQGITTGTSATTFSPSATVTRAQTVTFLWRMEGTPTVKVKNPFKDVKSGQYYTDAVLWAVENGITNGKTASTFAPNDPCTRAQIVTFLYRDLA